LAMIDKVSGQKVLLSSKNIQYSQSRELVENVFEKRFAINETESSVILHSGTFDHIDNQLMTSVDVQLILWNLASRNLSSESNGISSDILSCTLVDDAGNAVKIEKVGGEPIEI